METEELQTKLALQELSLNLKNLTDEVMRMTQAHKEMDGNIIRKMEDMRKSISQDYVTKEEHGFLGTQVQEIKNNLRWLGLTVIAGVITMVLNIFKPHV